MKHAWLWLGVVASVSAAATAAEPRGTEAEPGWAAKMKRPDADRVFGKQVDQARARKLDKLPVPAGAAGGFVKRKLKGQEVPLWSGPAPRLVPVNPEGGGTPLLIGVKLWAELSDERGTYTGKLVNPETYYWRPGARLYLWFETTAPCHLAVIERQDVGVGLAPAKKGKLVSPDPNFPRTYTVIPPGTPFRYPQLYALNDTRAPEFLTLLFLAAGKNLPSLTDPTGPGQPLPLDQGSTNPEDKLPGLCKKQNDLLESYGNKTLEGAVPVQAFVMGRFGPVHKGPGTYSSNKPGDVCTYLLGTRPFGFRTVRIYKAVVVPPGSLEGRP